jgi:hypothetical protein
MVSSTALQHAQALFVVFEAQPDVMCQTVECGRGGADSLVFEAVGQLAHLGELVGGEDQQGVLPASCTWSRSRCLRSR